MQPSNEMLTKLRALARAADAHPEYAAAAKRAGLSWAEQIAQGMLAKEILEDLARGE